MGLSNVENILEQALAGEPITIKPESRVEALLIALIETGGGGGGGTTDYTQLTNKPQIAGTTLTGNKTLNELGIASKADMLKRMQPVLSMPSAITDGLVIFWCGQPTTIFKTGGVYIYDGTGQQWLTMHEPPEIPENTSDLINDSGFITSTVNNLANYYLKSQTYTQAEVDALIAAAKNGRFISVTTLPTTDIDVKAIYLVPSDDPEAGNVKDEYINLDGTSAGWEFIGSTAIDLSGYVTDEELTAALADYTTAANLNTLLAGKVDKVTGKGLSTNDYTDADKAIVGGVTDALAGKVDKVTGKGLSTNDYTTAEKTKLAGLSNYDDTALTARVSAAETAIAGKANAEDVSALTEDYFNRNGMKNLIRLTESSQTYTGITNTIDKEAGTVTVSGTNTGSSAAFKVVAIYPAGYFKPGKYIFSGHPGGTGETLALRFRYISDGNKTLANILDNSEVEVTITPEIAACPTNVMTSVAKEATIDNVVLTPMLRYASNSDSTFEPYVKTNKELEEEITSNTEAIAANTSAIEAIVNEYGVKNLLPNNQGKNQSSSEPITYTQNADGSVSFSVTGAITTRGYFLVANHMHFSSNIKVNGLPNIDGCGAYLYDNTTSQYIWITEEDQTVTIDSTHDYGFVLVIENTVTSGTTGIYYPMIRDARITDPTYVPYAMTNKELTDEVTGVWDGINRIHLQGRDLTVVFASEIANYSDEWAWIQARLNAHNVSGLRVGDYIPIKVGTENHIAEIAGINTYRRIGDSGHEVGYHIDWITRDCYSQTVQFNTTNINNGNANNPNPFLASNLKSWLDGTLYPLLETKVKNVIKTKRILAPSRYQSGATLTDDNSWIWQDFDKLWVPLETEIFDCLVWSTKGYGNGQAVQYPIFANSYEHRMKGAGPGGARAHWWTASASSGYSAIVVLVHAHGHSTYYNASNAICVPVCFRTMEA